MVSHAISPQRAYAEASKGSNRDAGQGTYNISKSTEAKLSEDGAGTSSELDGGVAVGRHLSHTRVINNAQHGGEEGHGEDVVGVGEEANTCHQDSPHVVPAEGSLVDLGEGKTTSLIGVLDVDLRDGQYEWMGLERMDILMQTYKVIMEVVKRRVST